MTNSRGESVLQGPFISARSFEKKMWSILPALKGEVGTSELKHSPMSEGNTCIAESKLKKINKESKDQEEGVQQVNKAVLLLFILLCSMRMQHNHTAT